MGRQDECKANCADATAAPKNAPVRARSNTQTHNCKHQHSARTTINFLRRLGRVARQFAARLAPLSGPPTERNLALIGRAVSHPITASGRAHGSSAVLGTSSAVLGTADSSRAPRVSSRVTPVTKRRRRVTLGPPRDGAASHWGHPVTARGGEYASQRHGVTRVTASRRHREAQITTITRASNGGSFEPKIRSVKPAEVLTHATHVNGWKPAVYMSYMSQNFRLLRASNLSARKFRIFLLMYPGSMR